MCPRTLDLLGRSVHIEINHNYSDEDCHAIAWELTKSCIAYCLGSGGAAATRETILSDLSCTEEDSL